ncbi:MAG: DUF5989 family protein [Myxococcota bacterium]
MKSSRLRALDAKRITLLQLFRHFSRRERLFWLPLLLVLLAGGVLLLLTSGLGYVAPFVYSIF